MTAPKDAKARKEAQRKRDKVLGIERVDVLLSAREREQLGALCRQREAAGHRGKEQGQLQEENIWGGVSKHAGNHCVAV